MILAQIRDISYTNKKPKTDGAKNRTFRSSLPFTACGKSTQITKIALKIICVLSEKAEFQFQKVNLDYMHIQDPVEIRILSTPLVFLELEATENDRPMTRI